MDGLPDKPNLRTDEVAEFFDVSSKTVLRWAKEGKLFNPSKILKLDGGHLRFPRKEVINAVRLMSERAFKDVDSESCTNKKGARSKPRGVRSKGVE